jgi:tetratricopeptide (TPR) repeat protein
MIHPALLVLLLAAAPLAASLRAEDPASGAPAAVDLPAAETLLAEGDAAAAADAFTAIVEAEPENARAWLGLGKARHELGAEQEALAALARAGELGAAPPSVAFHTARVYASLGDLDGVRTWLGRMADMGAAPWGQLRATPELAALIEEPSLREVMVRLHPCGAEPFRRFDFWLGDWDVHRAGGGSTAHNSIASLHDGCVIRESYTSPGGYSGMSLNYYDEDDGHWHQLWLDNQGLVLKLEGGWSGESMVLSNDESRITWTPHEDGSVQQVWEQTEDGGKTWKVVFDGKYVRRAGS